MEIDRTSSSFGLTELNVQAKLIVFELLYDRKMNTVKKGRMMLVPVRVWLGTVFSCEKTAHCMYGK